MAIEKDEKGRPKFQQPTAELKKDMEKSRRLGMLTPPSDNAERDAALERLASEMNERLAQLCDFYGIPLSPQKNLELALQLARDFVPNFDLLGQQKGRGAPLKNTLVSDATLVHAVDLIAQERKKGVADACRILSMRPGEWKDIKPSTLETLYHGARNRVAAIAQTATKNKS